MLIENGKLRLSNGAMKAAANHLKSWKTAPNAAMTALRAGLRHDAPAALVFPSVGDAPEIRIDAPLTWYLSDVGSGATEVLGALAQNAANHGWSVARTLSHNANIPNWHPADMTAFSFYDASGRAGFEHHLRSFAGGNVQVFEILTPAISKLHRAEAMTYYDNFRQVANKMPKGSLVIFEHWQGDAMRELADEFRDLATEKKCQIVLHVWGHSCDDPALGVRSEDGLILGKSICQPERLGLDLNAYREGHCAIRTPSGFVETEGPYNPNIKDGAPLFEESFRKMVQRMDAAIAKSAPATHIARLELIAKTCGYRNWHAAQGAGKNQEKAEWRGPSPSRKDHSQVPAAAVDDDLDMRGYEKYMAMERDFHRQLKKNAPRDMQIIPESSFETNQELAHVFEVTTTVGAYAAVWRSGEWAALDRWGRVGQPDQLLKNGREITLHTIQNQKIFGFLKERGMQLVERMKREKEKEVAGRHARIAAFNAKVKAKWDAELAAEEEMKKAAIEDPSDDGMAP